MLCYAILLIILSIQKCVEHFLAPLSLTPSPAPANQHLVTPFAITLRQIASKRRTHARTQETGEICLWFWTMCFNLIAVLNSIECFLFRNLLRTYFNTQQSHNKTPCLMFEESVQCTYNLNTHQCFDGIATISNAQIAFYFLANSLFVFFVFFFFWFAQFGRISHSFVLHHQGRSITFKHHTFFDAPRMTTFIVYRNLGILSQYALYQAK